MELLIQLVNALALAISKLMEALIWQAYFLTLKALHLVNMHLLMERITQSNL